MLQKLLQHQSEDPPDPRQLRPDLPEDLSRVVRKLLAKNPQQRYQQPDDLAADLLMLAAKHGLQLPTPTTAQRAASREQKPAFLVQHLPWLAPVGVLALVAFALAIGGNGPNDGVHPAPIHHLTVGDGAPTDHSPSGISDRGAGDDTQHKPAADHSATTATGDAARETGGNQEVARASAAGNGAPIVTTAQIADTLADLRGQVKILIARVEQMADKSLEPRTDR